MKFDRTDWYPPARVVAINQDEVDQAFAQSEIIE